MEPEDGGPDLGQWRRAYRSTLPGQPSGCPGDETLAALVVDELAGAERAGVADHVSACARCAEDYRLLVELNHDAAAHSGAPARRRGWLPAAAAAAAAVALAITGVALRLGLQERDGDHLRGGAGTQHVAPAPDAALAAPPAELAWEPEPGALGYRVRLFDARANLVWQSEASASTSRPLTAEARGRLAPGASYFWVVDVEGPVARSRLGPFWFRLKDGR